MSHNQTSGAIYIYIFIPLDPKNHFKKKNTFLSPKKVWVTYKKERFRFLYIPLSINPGTHTLKTPIHPPSVRPSHLSLGPGSLIRQGTAYEASLGTRVFFFPEKKWRHPKIGSNLHPPKNLRWRHGETTIWMKVYFLLVLLKMMIFQCRHGGCKKYNSPATYLWGPERAVSCRSVKVISFYLPCDFEDSGVLKLSPFSRKIITWFVARITPLKSNPKKKNTPNGRHSVAHFRRPRWLPRWLSETPVLKSVVVISKMLKTMRKMSVVSPPKGFKPSVKLFFLGGGKTGWLTVVFWAVLSLSSWWLNQPLWKNMLVKMGSSSPNFRG